MIGRSPFFHGARTTNINTVLIPLKMTIHAVNGFSEIFDPDAAYESADLFAEPAERNRDRAQSYTGIPAVDVLEFHDEWGR